MPTVCATLALGLGRGAVNSWAAAGRATTHNRAVTRLAPCRPSLDLIIVRVSRIEGDVAVPACEPRTNSRGPRAHARAGRADRPLRDCTVNDSAGHFAMPRRPRGGRIPSGITGCPHPQPPRWEGT